MHYPLLKDLFSQKKKSKVSILDQVVLFVRICTHSSEEALIYTIVSIQTTLFSSQMGQNHQTKEY